jgi:hypothetical protein
MISMNNNKLFRIRLTHTHLETITTVLTFKDNTLAMLVVCSPRACVPAAVPSCCWPCWPHAVPAVSCPPFCRYVRAHVPPTRLHDEGHEVVLIGVPGSLAASPGVSTYSSTYN